MAEEPVGGQIRVERDKTPEGLQFLRQTDEDGV